MQPYSRPMKMHDVAFCCRKRGSWGGGSCWLFARSQRGGTLNIANENSMSPHDQARKLCCWFCLLVPSLPYFYQHTFIASSQFKLSPAANAVIESNRRELPTYHGKGKGSFVFYFSLCSPFSRAPKIVGSIHQEWMLCGGDGCTTYLLTNHIIWSR